ncbi:MAG: hypothetical protein A2Z16_05870 [Chloroflexi bacterium RBG_16_54_18]|nr:MAG: hypothetical protein A2Z16_05870 [Chloroflexi bacterium RBG_16_54_18]
MCISGRRTAPSAGALLALEMYVVTHTGLYRYERQAHALSLHQSGDLRQQLSTAALDQICVLKAAAVFVITADFDRLFTKYGKERSRRYAYMEAGHAAQNLLLQAAALGLGAVPAGAFSDVQVKEVLELPADQQPLYLIPAGYRK